MPNRGMTAAKFDVNIRALRGTVMSTPVTNTATESDFYVGLPTAFNAVPTGILAQDVVEPGYPLTSETFNDPTNNNPINGSTPPAPFSSQGRAWALITGNPGEDVEVIAADLTVTQNCDVVIADAYGRVTNASNVQAGVVANVIGQAKYAPGAVNQRIRISVGFRARKM